MKPINLNPFSVDDLLSLRDRINTLLRSRVDQERRDLENRLKRLKGFKSDGTEPSRKKAFAAVGKTPAKKKRAKSGKVAPKYRNPANPTETWTGRGLQPRWMRAALNGGAGKSLEDFRI